MTRPNFSLQFPDSPEVKAAVAMDKMAAKAEIVQWTTTMTYIVKSRDQNNYE